MFVETCVSCVNVSWRDPVISTCRLDWCNSPVYGVPENQLRKVQLVQNAAARLLTSAHRCDHITPLLRQLHWLPVQR